MLQIVNSLIKEGNKYYCFGRYEDINQYEEKAPYAKEAHPWPEHFYPLHVAMGAASEKWKAELIHHSWTSLTSLSYASYKFVATD